MGQRREWLLAKFDCCRSVTWCDGTASKCRCQILRILGSLSKEDIRCC